MGYHSKKIERGQLGHHSKIREEFEEFQDAIEQGNPVMALLELSDMLGAIEAYTLKSHNITLNDLLVMKNVTQSAFQDGSRSPKYLHTKWKCRRCGYGVDMNTMRCNCITSPSPWEPV